jgi:hypothetical protein
MAVGIKAFNDQINKKLSDYEQAIDKALINAASGVALNGKIRVYIAAGSIEECKEAFHILYPKYKEAGWDSMIIPPIRLTSGFYIDCEFKPVYQIDAKPISPQELDLIGKRKITVVE